MSRPTPRAFDRPAPILDDTHNAHHEVGWGVVARYVWHHGAALGFIGTRSIRVVCTTVSRVLPGARP